MGSVKHNSKKHRMLYLLCVFLPTDHSFQHFYHFNCSILGLGLGFFFFTPVVHTYLFMDSSCRNQYAHPVYNVLIPAFQLL